MRRGIRNGLVAGWVVLAAGGWGVSRWMGEPSATGGPAPVTPPSSGAEPGPQPESACGDFVAAPPGPSASPNSSAALTKVAADGKASVGVRVCDSARSVPSGGEGD
ncbi:hypothetical protein [Streptomyces sp. ML-6]|uniref:hypothetical protein n=1 Tax=Streptomyces sp. ML-6 TaxID=2982693 RepID=UPI0024BF987D|nr:hypothetical protein [Streptomyces sp. ML-6]MDK0521713.1 hypothetical protein [Streptomyces sp. ML-6]